MVQDMNNLVLRLLQNYTDYVLTNYYYSQINSRLIE
jgi:ferritin-like protein